METPPMDEIDRQAIRHLEADGRKSFREIARELNVSEATVRARVRRLQESGILKIVAFANPAQVGPSQLGLLLLRVAAEHRADVITALSERAEISYVSTALGRANLFAQVLVRDVDALSRFVAEYVERLPGVTEAEILVEIEVHKLHFASP